MIMHRERLVRARHNKTRPGLSAGARGYACPPARGLLQLFPLRARRSKMKAHFPFLTHRLQLREPE